MRSMIERFWRLALVPLTAAILLAAAFTYTDPPIVESKLEPASFNPVRGNNYIARFAVLPIWWLPSDPFRRSYDGTELKLFEDGRPLGPNRVLHTRIAELGKGRYSYWNRYLYFSSSDNSDPRTNGRVYSATYPLYVSPFLAVASFLGLLLGMAGIPRAKRILRRAGPPTLAVVIGLVMVTALVETVLRTDFMRTNVVGASGGYANFPERLRPTLNSLGYRDVEHAKEKPPGTIRILVLGDSMTFGHAIADDEIWPRRLAELVGPRVEIIAMAHNGWSTADQLHALRRGGLEYDPDLVVVGVVDNDLQPPSWEPSGKQADWIMFRGLSNSLDLFRLLDSRINRFADKMGWRYSYSQWRVDTFDPDKPYWPRWLGTVADFGAELRRRRIPGFAFLLPSPADLSVPETVAHYKSMQPVFAKNGFTSVNLQPALVREFGPVPGKHLWALPNDGHPGPVFNEFFARFIWEVIRPAVHARLMEVRATR